MAHLCIACIEWDGGACESWHTVEWVMSHVWTGLICESRTGRCHVTCMNESWHTFELWMQWEWRMKWEWSACKSLHTVEWVMSHVWMSHGTHLNYEWNENKWEWMRMKWEWNDNDEGSENEVLVSHYAQWNESCRTYEWVMAHIWIRNEMRINENEWEWNENEMSMMKEVRMRCL